MPKHARSSPTSLSRTLLEFFGSMNLAVSLLCMVGIASAVGTLLQQNQPYQDYLLRFGPFWFEVFERLGLYDVYAAPWFLFVFAFLVISTSICLYRQTPAMMRDMGAWHDRVQARSLRVMKHSDEWRTGATSGEALRAAAEVIQRAGYQLRHKTRARGEMLSAKRGMTNRIGYLLTHLGIVVTCIGGAMDSNIQLKWREWMGQLEVETRNIPANQVGDKSWLDIDNAAFRGNVNIPEGRSSDLVFLAVRDGYVVQKLPFEIELVDFRIEHYKTGQPKSFESDLVIRDEKLGKPLEQTISVNHPLTYRGHTIYQASFQDGGSGVTFEAQPLTGNESDRQRIETAVFEEETLELDGRRYQLEVSDFGLFNIQPVEGEDGQETFKNFGPKVTYKLRNSAGEAREYETYMAPVPVDGEWYISSGMRSEVGESFRYLRIPVDEQRSARRFWRFFEALRDSERVEGLIEAHLAERERTEPGALNQPLGQAMQLLLERFVEGGYEAMVEDLESRVPEGQREAVFRAYLNVLRSALALVYQDVLERDATDEDWRFFDDAVDAISAMPHYGSPVLLTLDGFEHKQASGLQITRSPGKFWVYLGSAMLTLGVFMLFYISRRRLWLILSREGGETGVILAGQSHRKTGDFNREFDRLRQALRQAVPPANDAPDGAPRPGE
ncbi:MAG: cytochrome c biogenesis protein ResB [Pseudomonadota bacterium]